MTLQEKFEVDYLSAFRPPKSYIVDFSRDGGGYAAPAIDNMFKVWLQQAKRHEAELAFIKLAKQQIEDRLISCEQSLANAFDECEQLRAKSEAAISELVAALKRCRDMVGHPDNVAIIDAVIAKYKVKS